MAYALGLISWNVFQCATGRVQNYMIFKEVKIINLEIRNVARECTTYRKKFYKAENCIDEMFPLGKKKKKKKDLV